MHKNDKRNTATENFFHKKLKLQSSENKQHFILLLNFILTGTQNSAHFYFWKYSTWQLLRHKWLQQLLISKIAATIYICIYNMQLQMSIFQNHKISNIWMFYDIYSHRPKAYYLFIYDKVLYLNLHAIFQSSLQSLIIST